MMDFCRRRAVDAVGFRACVVLVPFGGDGSLSYRGTTGGSRNLLPRDEVMSGDDGDERRSWSDNLGGRGGGGVSDDDDGEQSRRKGGYHRHNPGQIQELEAFFREVPHPDDRQRLELSRRLGLDVRQIKFWFQNRRTQLKGQTERHENILLKEDNTRLKNENDVLKIRLTDPACSQCNGPMYSNAAFGLSSEEQQLIKENVRLKDELVRLRALAEKLSGKPIDTSHMTSKLPGSNGDSNHSRAKKHRDVLKNGGRMISTRLSLRNGTSTRPSVCASDNRPFEKAGLIETAISAMNQLMKLAEACDPIWTRTFAGSTELLNREEYLKMFSNGDRLRSSGVVGDGSRDTAMVSLNSQAIVGIFMDVNKWIEAFPFLIARASTVEVISTGVSGSKDGYLQLMKAEFQVLSPLVPTRQVRFVRLCKQQREGLWAVVDVSVEDHTGFRAPVDCRRLPSGCILQDLPNNCTKVTWIEHSEWDVNAINPLFRQVINTGNLFGAPRWVASLQRHCESLPMLMQSGNSHANLSGISPGGKRNILKLVQRMDELFCSGVCASTRSKWENIHVGNISEDVKLRYRRNISNPGEPPGLLLCASTSFRMPVNLDVLFNFLRNEQSRSQWDILSLSGAMQEIFRVSKGPGHSNYVSLLRVVGMDSSHTGMMVVQESWIDASGALIIYAPVDASVITDAIHGRDTESVALLPSGFSIIPDGPSPGQVNGYEQGGCLVTIGFQILVNTTPSANLTPESFNSVHNLISFTIHKIKVALHLN